MASTVLPNGIIIPEKYSRDWYADLYHNWQELDNLLGGELSQFRRMAQRLELFQQIRQLMKQLILKFQM